MKRKLSILYACFICIEIVAQIDLMHYKMMYDTIMKNLNIQSAYVSDSLWELENLGYELYAMKLRDSVPLYNPYHKQKSEYSELLHANFESIEEAVDSISPWSNVIYFSSAYKSYVSADAYVNAKCMNLWGGSFPTWGYYESWYFFLFQIKEDGIILIDKTRVHEM